MYIVACSVFSIVCLNLFSKDGFTALHWATMVARYKIVQLLLEHDADVNLQNVVSVVYFSY